MSPVLSVTPLYIALSGLMFLFLTARVGAYRRTANISIGTGNDPEMLRRFRGQANFIETVPIALLLLVSMEMLGAPPVWIHPLGLLLVLGRAAHYLGLTEIAPLSFRAGGMVATILTILIASVWVLVAVLS